MEFNYTNCVNEREVKEKAKKDLLELFREFLEEKFDMVGYIDKNTIGFHLGVANDKDGFPCDVNAVISPSIKDYQEHNGKHGIKEPFDLQEAIEFYNFSCELEEQNYWEK